jgi:CRP-like cAMP-binding protein
MHRTETFEDRIAALPVFAGTRRRDLRHLMRLMTPATVKAGRTLAVQGDPGTQCMLIVDGRARVLRNGQLVAVLEAGDLLGEIAVVRGGGRTATVVTDCETTLEVFTPKEFAAARREHAGLEHAVQVCLASRALTSVGAVG